MNLTSTWNKLQKKLLFKESDGNMFGNEVHLVHSWGHLKKRKTENFWTGNDLREIEEFIFTFHKDKDFPVKLWLDLIYS